MLSQDSYQFADHRDNLEWGASPLRKFGSPEIGSTETSCACLPLSVESKGDWHASNKASKPLPE